MAFLAWFKKVFIKFVITKTVQTTVGFQGWAVTFLAKIGFKEIIIPTVNFSFRKIALIYDKSKGHFVAKRMDKAKEEKNEQDYNDTLSNN